MPRFGERTEGAGDQLNVDAFFQNEWNEGFHLPIANERVATNYGKVERTVFIDDL